MKKPEFFVYGLDFLKDLNLITIILAPFILDLKLDLNAYVYVVASFRITQLFCSIPAGIMVDKISPKLSIFISGLLYLAGLIFLSFQNLSISNFIFFNVLNALSFCFYGASSNKYLKQISNFENFNKHYSKKMSFRKIGNISSGLIATILLLFLSFREIIYVQISISLLFLFITFFLKNTSSVSIKKFILKEIPLKEIFEVVLSLAPFFIIVDLFFVFLINKVTQDPKVFTILLTIGNIFVVLAMNYSMKIKNIFPTNSKKLFMITILPIIVYIITQNPFLAIGFVPISILSRSVSIFKMSDFLKNIDSKKMGTCEAIINTTNTSIVGLFAIIFGKYLIPNEHLWVFILIGCLVTIGIFYSVKTLFISSKS